MAAIRHVLFQAAHMVEAARNPITPKKTVWHTTKRFCFQAASAHLRQHRCHNLIFIIQQRQQIQIFRAD